MGRIRKAIDGLKELIEGQKAGPHRARPPGSDDGTVASGARTGAAGGERMPGGGTGMPPESDVSDVGRTGPAGGERAPGGGVRLGTSIGDTGNRSDGGAPSREWPLRSDQRK